MFNIMETIIVMILLLSLTSVQGGKWDEAMSRALTETYDHFKPAPKGIDFGPGKYDIPRYKFEIDDSGNYIYAFSTFELSRYEVGEVKNPGTDKETLVVRGKYIDRVVIKGGLHIVREFGYIADENGYQPFIIGISFVLSQRPQLPPGLPQPGAKEGIGSAAIATLSGGNFG